MNRFRVILILFDLHSKTLQERREYRKFHKYLINNGYMFVQESVYAKLLKSPSACSSEMTSVADAAPPEGNVIVIPMTLSDFKNVKFPEGKEFNYSVFSDTVLFL